MAVKDRTHAATDNISVRFDAPLAGLSQALPSLSRAVPGYRNALPLEKPPIPNLLARPIQQGLFLMFWERPRPRRARRQSQRSLQAGSGPRTVSWSVNIL